jgi:hypothetical protein
MEKHKHYDCIIAFANGKEIQYYASDVNDWVDIKEPTFVLSTKYRVKPKGIEYEKLIGKVVKTSSGNTFMIVGSDKSGLLIGNVWYYYKDVNHVFENLDGTPLF